MVRFPTAHIRSLVVLPPCKIVLCRLVDGCCQGNWDLSDGLDKTTILKGENHESMNAGKNFLHLISVSLNIDI